MRVSATPVKSSLTSSGVSIRQTQPRCNRTARSLSSAAPLTIVSITDIGFALTRFNPDGTTDFGFGSGGKQITDFFDAGAKANGVVLQPDGKFVVAGLLQTARLGQLPLILRSPVTTQMAVLTPVSASAEKPRFLFRIAPPSRRTLWFSRLTARSSSPEQLSRLSQLRLTLLCGATTPTAALIRVSVATAAVTTDIAGGTDNAQAVAIQADGNVVVAGRAFRSSFDLTLARYVTTSRL